MGKVKITRVESSDDEFSELSINAIMRSLKIKKVSGSYFISLGSTEVEISADLMKNLIENAFMMLDYEDQRDLLSLFSAAVR